MSPFRHVTCKLGNMRKAVEWTIYPRKAGERVKIQSSTRIAVFDPETGEGLLSAYRSGGAYFMHLEPALGAKRITVPREVLEEAVALAPVPNADGTIRIT